MSAVVANASFPLEQEGADQPFTPPKKSGDDGFWSTNLLLKLGCIVAFIVLIVCLLILALRGGAGTPGVPGVPDVPSLYKPLPYLTWDEGASGKERFDGWIEVPLNPLDSESPTLKLRLTMRPSPTQPAPLGPMLVHCGGPSSLRNCVDEHVPNGDTLEKELADKYDLFGIDQRGIGDSEPVLTCAGTQVVLPAVLEVRANPTDFFQNCSCEGMLVPSVRFKTNVNWEASSEYFQTTSEMSKACYNADFFKKGKYNVMDYMGTAYLAHDLNLLRAAIGAKKLSVLGLSYGTWVGSVYASLYPDNSDKIIIIGSLPPAPTVPDWARDYAISQQGVRAEMVSRCRELEARDPERQWCGTRDPEEAFRAATEMLENGDFKAESNFGPVTLSPLIITQYMQDLLQDKTHRVADPSQLQMGMTYLRFAQIVNAFMDTENKTLFTQVMLDSSCYLNLPLSMLGECVDRNGESLARGINATGKDMFRCPTWKQYGVCVSEVGSLLQTKLMITGVFSGDIPSRLLPSQMVDLEQRLKSQFGVVGARAAFKLDQTALWPSKATYPGIGTSAIKPLIMANLDDAATGFGWTQQMKLAFPASHLMTFQGYFHGFPSPFVMRERKGKGLYDCWVQLKSYVAIGVLPRNGYVCHMNPYLGDEPEPAGMQVKAWDFVREPYVGAWDLAAQVFEAGSV